MRGSPSTAASFSVLVSAACCFHRTARFCSNCRHIVAVANQVGVRVICTSAFALCIRRGGIDGAVERYRL